MANPKIHAQPRSVQGKKVKTLRRQGLVPGVVYGPALQGFEVITVAARELERIYERAGTSTLLDLVIEGGTTRPVLIHEVQFDAFRRAHLHIDFLAPDMKAELTVAVPVHLVGEAPALEEGGILNQHLTELQVRCLPDAIPHALEVDISSLTDFDAHILVGQVELPTGVTLVTAEDELLVKIDQPQLVPEDEEAAAEETTAEAGAEGDEAAATEEDSSDS